MHENEMRMERKKSALENFRDVCSIFWAVLTASFIACFGETYFI